ncbi:MAG TPA: hypothetical protein VMG37_10735 [Solirubrobacteraceae bacterium]|nr:hypothetical protein [Solirubrobacteraceae bacterium]
MVSVKRLSVSARLDESAETLAEAKAQAAEGDESWEQWVAEYQRGEALILRLDLTMEINDGDDEVISATRDGFFVENHIHAPRVERQIAELASGDFAALSADLASRGHAFSPDELGELYVHVELDDDVRRRLADGSRPPERPHRPQR